MARNTRIACLALAAATFGGCSPFMADRGHDLAQVMDLSAGYSEGFCVNLRASKFVQVGLGGYRGIYWTGLKSGEFDVWMEERAELGVGPLYMHEVFRSDGCRILDINHPLFGDAGFREYSWDLSHLTDRGWLDIGATVNLVILGLDASFKPAEFADFLSGFAGYDLLQDDVFSPSTDELLERLGGEDAWARAAAARALQRRFGQDYGYEIYSAPKHMTDRQMTALRFWRDRAATGTLVEPLTSIAEVVPAPAGGG